MKLDKIVVVDVESTCWMGRPPKGQANQIIEIGVCLLDVKTLRSSKKTSILVQPSRSKISKFCTKLTTITQAMIDNHGTSFAKACERLINEFDSQKRAWASYGNYDRTAFRENCKREGVAYPFGKDHINVKTLFALQNTLRRGVGMAKALKILDICLEGTHHRGHDDAWNTSKILADCLE